MGNGNSKVKVEPPKVAEVNVMITKEVTDRWEALCHQSKQQEAKEQGNDQLTVKKGKDISKNSPEVRLHQRETEVKESFTGESKSSFAPDDPPALKKKDDEPISMPGPKLDPPLDDQNQDITHNYDKMDKIANFFIPRNLAKSPFDLENGTNNQESVVNCETRHSDFFRHSTKDEDRAMYEEVNETDDVKKKPADFIDEEAAIGSDIAQLSSSSQKLKEIRVPRPALPVIIDEDEEGKITIETINAWKMKQRLEQQISESDAQWSGELRKISAKIENETRREADDFQKRIQAFTTRHRDLIEPPFIPGAHCNLLVTQIGDCYQRNENQVLKCSELVRQFALCTNKTG